MELHVLDHSEVRAFTRCPWGARLDVEAVLDSDPRVSLVGHDVARLIARGVVPLAHVVRAAAALPRRPLRTRRAGRPRRSRRARRAGRARRPRRRQRTPVVAGLRVHARFLAEVPDRQQRHPGHPVVQDDFHLLVLRAPGPHAAVLEGLALLPRRTGRPHRPGRASRSLSARRALGDLILSVSVRARLDVDGLPHFDAADVGRERVVLRRPAVAVLDVDVARARPRIADVLDLPRARPFDQRDGMLSHRCTSRRSRRRSESPNSPGRQRTASRTACPTAAGR